MKKTLLTLGLALSLTTSLLAQANPKPAAAAAELNQPRRYPAEVLKHEPYRDITLKPGTLRNVVQQLDVIFSAALENSNDVGLRMPNLVWTEDVMDLSISAPLRLCDVMALDALTLVGAAAGCRLEPVESVPTDTQPKRVLGYKFVRSDSVKPVPTTAVITGAKAIAPGNPATATLALPSGGMVNNPALALSSANLAASLTQLQQQLLSMKQTLTTNHPAFVNLTQQIKEVEHLQKAQLATEITRVYPIGSIVRGSGQVADDKLEVIIKAIHATMEQSISPPPKLNITYHRGANIMVIKAPVAAQDLIAQIFEALNADARVNHSQGDAQKTEK
jgi:hypothetical protein